MMKEKLIFLKQFILNPLQNASITPSSKKSSRAMLAGIDFSKIQTVVELGLGCFTEELLNQVQPGTNVILIEIQKDYIQILEKKYGDRVTIMINGIPVIKNITLRRSYQSFDIPLEVGINKISFIALNQGTSGPNTAGFKVYDDSGNVISSNEWNLATGAKAVILIAKDK